MRNRSTNMCSGTRASRAHQGILWVHIKTRVNGKEKRANSRASNSRLTVDLGSQPSSVHLHLSVFFRCWSRAQDQEPHSRTPCVLYTKNTQEQPSNATRTRTKVVTHKYKLSLETYVCYVRPKNGRDSRVTMRQTWRHLKTASRFAA